MNRKGETNTLGIIIIVAVTLIVGVTLFQVIAQEVGKSTNTITLSNATVGTMTNGTTIYLTDYRAISNVVIFNETGDVPIPSTNYTLTNNVIDPTTGGLSVSIEPNVTVTAPYAFNVGTATIDGVAQPTTYIAESGGRAMANLIVIFFALVIAVVALTPSLRNEVMSWIGK